MVSGTNASWALNHIIDLKTIGTLPALLTTICCVDGMATILMGIKDRDFFVVNLKSRRIRKIPEGLIAYPAVPYMSFYTPGTDLLSLDLPIFRISNISGSNLKIWMMACELKKKSLLMKREYQ